MTFDDLTKAFDIVSRDGLWKSVAKFASPDIFFSNGGQFQDCMLAWAQNDDEVSDPISVTNGV